MIMGYLFNPCFGLAHEVAMKYFFSRLQDSLWITSLMSHIALVGAPLQIRLKKQFTRLRTRVYNFVSVRKWDMRLSCLDNLLSLT